MQCAAYDDNDNRVPVTFGEDVATGCTLYQTYAQLTGGCAGIRQAIFNYQLGAFGNSLDRVAKFGNASFLNSFDWIPIIKDIPVELNSNQVRYFLFSCFTLRYILIFSYFNNRPAQMVFVHRY